MAKKLRYRLHWNSSHKPSAALKWVVFDWKLFCPVAYAETRVAGQRLRAFLNSGCASPTQEKPNGKQ